MVEGLAEPSHRLDLVGHRQGVGDRLLDRLRFALTGLDQGPALGSDLFEFLLQGVLRGWARTRRLSQGSLKLPTDLPRMLS